MGPGYLGETPRHVWHYTDADDGHLITELAIDESYEVIRHRITNRWDPIFQATVVVHDLIVRRH